MVEIAAVVALLRNDRKKARTRNGRTQSVLTGEAMLLQRRSLFVTKGNIAPKGLKEVWDSCETSFFISTTLSSIKSTPMSIPNIAEIIVILSGTVSASYRAAGERAVKFASGAMRV